LRIVLGLLIRALLSRRQFNLPRWTRRQEFRALHRDSVMWLDSRFLLIEQGAPWLVRVGDDVLDFCQGGVANRFERRKGRSGASVGCIRKVTVVYGFDGELILRLRSLDQAIPLAGWQVGTRALPQSWADLDPDRAARAEGLAGWRMRWMTDRRVSLRWSPTAATGYPANVVEMRPWGKPPFAPEMRVTWSSRGQSTGWRQDPDKKRDRTRNYLPLEISDLSVPELLEQALARYEHALTVTIPLGYYANPNAKVLGHRVPRYLLPSRRAVTRGRSG
jgi:hypothetical protein